MMRRPPPLADPLDSFCLDEPFPQPGQPVSAKAPMTRQRTTPMLTPPPWGMPGHGAKGAPPRMPSCDRKQAGAGCMRPTRCGSAENSGTRHRTSYNGHHRPLAFGRSGQETCAAPGRRRCRPCRERGSQRPPGGEQDRASAKAGEMPASAIPTMPSKHRQGGRNPWRRWQRQQGRGRAAHAMEETPTTTSGMRSRRTPRDIAEECLARRGNRRTERLGGRDS
jgi:hypothetical protein